MKKFALVAFYLVSVLLAARLSSRMSVEYQLAEYGALLQKVQGELAVNHLLRYVELQNNLEKGCKDAVLEKLKISVAEQSMVISSFLQSQRSGELSQYIAKQSPGLEARLVNFKSPYGASFKEPACN